MTIIIFISVFLKSHSGAVSPARLHSENKTLISIYVAGRSGYLRCLNVWREIPTEAEHAWAKTLRGIFDKRSLALHMKRPGGEKKKHPSNCFPFIFIKINK